MDVLLGIFFLLSPLFALFFFIMWVKTKRQLRSKINATHNTDTAENQFEDIGLYRPQFNFSDSDQFKKKIISVRAEQKSMIASQEAVHFPSDWTVQGSKTKGKAMINKAAKLCLRAFNTECEAAIAQVRWNNVNAAEKRLSKSFTDINKLNETLDVSITERYLRLKLKELLLTHEYREKQKEERDHKSELRRLKREEEKLLKDAAKAEKQEEKYQWLLDQAMAEARDAVGAEAEAYQRRIAKLNAELTEAHSNAVRAKSMAEQTRAGYIYVISNVGSFGDGIYKIGMTRRLEPMDRVRELGDASVPFLFDTHAMIYTEDAPKVEKMLHAALDKYRVNLVNGRKEFFRVSLDKIIVELRKYTPNVEYTSDIEAQEYNETLSVMRSKRGSANSENYAIRPIRHT